MIGGFGDLSTSDTEGFIHALRGEHVMVPSAAAANRPWLDAMNSGLNLSSALRGSPRALGAAPGGGSGMAITITALDAKSVDYWLRNGGAQKIQAAVNVNTGRYAGVGLGTT